jgi:hypothetical protein
MTDTVDGKIAFAEDTSGVEAIAGLFEATQGFLSDGSVIEGIHERRGDDDVSLFGKVFEEQSVGDLRGCCDERPTEKVNDTFGIGGN